MFYILSAAFFSISAPFIFKKWRIGVFLILTFLIIEDTLRKIFPDWSSLIVLLKDVLIALTYFSFFVFFAINRKKIWKPIFIIPLFIFFSFWVINIFNYGAPNLFFGLVGMRNYLWYIPLMFLGYYMFQNKEQCLKFIKILSYAALPLFILVVLQFLFFGSELAILNPLSGSFKSHSFTLVESEQVPLLTSFFGTAHRYSRFSMILFFLTIAVLFSGFKNKLLLTEKEKFILSFAAISAFLGVVLSGVRTAFILALFGSITIFIFSFIKKDNIVNFLKNNKKLLAYLLLTIFLISAFIFFFARDFGVFQITSFYFAFQERIPWAFAEFIRAFSDASLFGNGTGTMSQGIENIPNGIDWTNRQTRELRDGFWFETGVGRVLFEGGMVGFIVFYFFWGYLLFSMFKTVKIIKDFNLKSIGMAIFIFSFLMLIWFSFLHHQVLSDATTLIILWFFAGVLFGLKNLDLKADSVVK